jgi:hypothetical protein
MQLLVEGQQVEAVEATLTRTEALNLRLGLSKMLAASEYGHVHVQDQAFTGAELTVSVEPADDLFTTATDRSSRGKAVAEELLARLAQLQKWLLDSFDDETLVAALLETNIADDPADADKPDLRRSSYWAGAAGYQLLLGVGVAAEPGDDSARPPG